jgi:hypothetical protein
MSIPDFPNGFESWQKTHFEVVEVLCYMRSLEEGKAPKVLSKWLITLQLMNCTSLR